MATKPPRVATSRYFHTALVKESGLVPLATTVGNPKGRLGFELGGSVQPVAPHGAFRIEDEAEFRQVYTARLDSFGVEAIGRLFAAFADAYNAEGVVVLCFCDVNGPGFCHRRVFAEWWEEKTGQEVPEL
jgi:hypothetical protein